VGAPDKAAPPRLGNAQLRGERVLLRPVCSGDAGRAFSLLHGCDEILRWLLWDGPASAAELEESYSSWARRSRQGDDYHFAICSAEGGELSGSIGLRFQGHAGLGDLGYWLAPECWGRGMMSEAVLLVTHLAFRHLAARSTYGYVFLGNDSSRRVLEKAGHELQYTSRGKVVKRGRAIDEWYLAAMRAAWLQSFEEWRPVDETIELWGEGEQ